MSRSVIAFSVSAVVILSLIGLYPPLSVAQSGTPAATPAFIQPCMDATPTALDVRPPDNQVGHVIPGPVVLTPGASPVSGDAAGRELYLVVINLAPGQCIPYDALSNQKNGAIVWFVQQGKVEYAWQMVANPPPDSTPIIGRGDVAGNKTNLNNERHGPGEPQILYPGDWVTQDRQVEANLRNVGADTAVILKAVYAVPVRPGGGCGGDCN